MPSTTLTQSRVNLLEHGLKKLRRSDLMVEPEFRDMYTAVDRHHADMKLAHLTGKPKDLLQQAHQDTQFYYILIKMLSEVSSSKKTEQRSNLLNVHDWYIGNRHVLYSGPHFGKEHGQSSGFVSPRTPKSGKSSARIRASNSRPGSKLKFLKTDDDFEDIFNDDLHRQRLNARPKSAPESIHRKRANQQLALHTHGPPNNSPLPSPPDCFDHVEHFVDNTVNQSKNIYVDIKQQRPEPDEAILPKRLVHSLSSLVNPHTFNSPRSDITAEPIKFKAAGTSSVPRETGETNPTEVHQITDHRSEHLRKWDEYQQEINYGQDILAHLQHIGRNGTAHGVRYVAHEMAQMPEFQTKDVISRYVIVTDEQNNQNNINPEPIIHNQSLEEFYETANGYYPSKLPKYPSFNSVPSSRTSSRKNSAKMRSENKENLAVQQKRNAVQTNSLDEPVPVNPNLKLDIVIDLVNTVTEDMVTFKEKLVPEPAPGFKQPVTRVEPTKPRPHTAPPGDGGRHYANINFEMELKENDLTCSSDHLYNSQPLKDPELNRAAVNEAVDWRGKITPNTSRYKMTKTGFGGHTYVKNFRPRTPKNKSLRTQGSTSAGSRPRTAPVSIKEKWNVEYPNEDNIRAETAATHSTREVDPEVMDTLFQVQHFDSGRKKVRTRLNRRNIITLEREIARNFYGPNPEPSIEYLTLCTPKSILASRESSGMADRRGHNMEDGHFDRPYDLPFDFNWDQSNEMFGERFFMDRGFDKDLLQDENSSMSADLERRSLNDLSETDETDHIDQDQTNVTWAEKEIQVEFDGQDTSSKENIEVDLTRIITTTPVQDGSLNENSLLTEEKLADNETVEKPEPVENVLETENGEEDKVQTLVEKEVKFAEPEILNENEKHAAEETAAEEISVAGMKFRPEKVSVSVAAGQKARLTKASSNTRQAVPLSVTAWQPFTDSEPRIERTTNMSKTSIHKQSLVKPGRLASSGKPYSPAVPSTPKPHRSILKIEYQPPVEKVPPGPTEDSDLIMMPLPPKPRGASPPRAYSGKINKSQGAEPGFYRQRVPRHHPLSAPRRTPPSIPSAQTPFSAKASPRTGQMYMAEAESHARKDNSPRNYMQKVGGLRQTQTSMSFQQDDVYKVEKDLLSSVSVMKLNVENKKARATRPHSSPDHRTKHILIDYGNGYMTPPPSQQDTESLSSKHKSPAVPANRPIPDYVDVQDPEKYAAAMQLQNEAKAAVNIQRYFRGYVGRNYFKRIMKEKREKLEDQRTAAIQIQRTLRGHLSRKKAIYNRQPNPETLAWAKEYKVILTKQALERQSKMEALSREINGNQIKANAKLSIIGPHVEIYQNFHPKMTGPSKWQIQKSAVVIQKWIRGWLIRRQFERLHRKAKVHAQTWQKFVILYKDLLKRVQTRHGVEKPKTPFNIAEVNEFMDLKKRYESVFDKKAFGNEMDISELSAYFKECDLYPSQPEIDETVDLVFRGQSKKGRSRGLTKNEVMEITFQLYVPRATGLTNLRKSTWMNPIIDGEEAIKLLGTEAVEETDFKTCWKLVADSKKQQKTEEQKKNGSQ